MTLARDLLAHGARFWQSVLKYFAPPTTHKMCSGVFMLMYWVHAGSQSLHCASHEEGSQPSLWSILRGWMVLPNDKCWWESANVCRLSKLAGCVIKEEEQKAFKLLCRVSDDASQWLLVDGWILQSASFLSHLHHHPQHNTEQCKGASEVQSQSCQY